MGKYKNITNAAKEKQFAAFQEKGRLARKKAKAIASGKEPARELHLKNNGKEYRMSIYRQPKGPAHEKKNILTQSLHVIGVGKPAHFLAGENMFKSATTLQEKKGSKWMNVFGKHQGSEEFVPDDMWFKAYAEKGIEGTKTKRFEAHAREWFTNWSEAMKNTGELGTILKKGGWVNHGKKSGFAKEPAVDFTVPALKKPDGTFPENYKGERTVYEFKFQTAPVSRPYRACSIKNKQRKIDFAKENNARLVTVQVIMELERDNAGEIKFDKAGNVIIKRPIYATAHEVGKKENPNFDAGMLATHAIMGKILYNKLGDLGKIPGTNKDYTGEEQ